MATLTVQEIAYIRMMSGDDCEVYDVSPVLLQYLHDSKATLAPLCMMADPLGGTIVWVIRARLAKAVKLFDEDGEGGSRSVSQKFDHLKDLLADWESRCGMSGGGITIGTLDLGIDSDSDGSEYASRLSYWSWGGYL